MQPQPLIDFSSIDYLHSKIPPSVQHPEDARGPLHPDLFGIGKAFVTEEKEGASFKHNIVWNTTISSLMHSEIRAFYLLAYFLNEAGYPTYIYQHPGQLKRITLNDNLFREVINGGTISETELLPLFAEHNLARASTVILDYPNARYLMQDMTRLVNFTFSSQDCDYEDQRITPTNLLPLLEGNTQSVSLDQTPIISKPSSAPWLMVENAADESFPSLLPTLKLLKHAIHSLRIHVRQPRELLEVMASGLSLDSVKSLELLFSKRYLLTEINRFLQIHRELVCLGLDFSPDSDDQLTHLMIDQELVLVDTLEVLVLRNLQMPPDIFLKIAKAFKNLRVLNLNYINMTVDSKITITGTENIKTLGLTNISANLALAMLEHAKPENLKLVEIDLSNHSPRDITSFDFSQVQKFYIIRVNASHQTIISLIKKCAMLKALLLVDLDLQDVAQEDISQLPLSNLLGLSLSNVLMSAKNCIALIKRTSDLMTLVLGKMDLEGLTERDLPSLQLQRLEIMHLHDIAISLKILIAIINSAPALDALYLTNIRFYDTETDLKLLKLNNLKILCLQSVSITTPLPLTLLNNAPNLVELSLINGIFPSFPANVSFSLPLLRILRLSNISIAFIDLIRTLECMPNIEIFHISGEIRGPFSYPLPKAVRFNQVRSLQLDSLSLSANELDMLLAHFPNLENVFMDGCTNLTPADIHHLNSKSSAFILTANMDNDEDNTNTFHRDNNLLSESDWQDYPGKAPIAVEPAGTTTPTKTLRFLNSSVSLGYGRSYCQYLDTQTLALRTRDPNIDKSMQLSLISNLAEYVSKQKLHKKRESTQYKFPQMAAGHFYVLPLLTAEDILIGLSNSLDINLLIFLDPVGKLYYIQPQQDIQEPIGVAYTVSTPGKSLVYAITEEDCLIDHLELDGNNNLVVFPPSFSKLSKRAQLDNLLIFLENLNFADVERNEKYTWAKTILNSLPQDCAPKLFLFICVLTKLGFKVLNTGNPLYSSIEIELENKVWRIFLGIQSINAISRMFSHATHMHEDADDDEEAGATENPDDNIDSTPLSVLMEAEPEQQGTTQFAEINACLRQKNWHNPNPVNFKLQHLDIPFEIIDLSSEANKFGFNNADIYLADARSIYQYFDKSTFTLRTIDPNVEKCDTLIEITNLAKFIDNKYRHDYYESAECIVAPMQAGRYYVLPSLAPEDILVKIDTSPTIKFKKYYDTVSKLYYIQPVEDIYESVKLNYTINTPREAPEYKVKSSVSIIKSIKFDTNGNTVIDPPGFFDLAPNAQIDNLIIFFRRFRPDLPEPLAIINSKYDWANNLLKKMQGACEERAFLFSAVMKNLGFQVAVLSNPMHSYTEMEINNQTLRIDLGGMEPKFRFIEALQSEVPPQTDNAESESYEDFYYDAPEVQQEESDQLPATTLPDFDVAPREENDAKLPTTDAYPASDVMTDTAGTPTTDAPNIVVIARSGAEIADYNLHMLRRLQQNYFYLHSFDDILLQQFVATATENTYIPGEFSKFLQRPGGTLAINISKLQATQLLTYLHLIKQKRFMGIDCAKDLRIVFIANDNNNYLVHDLCQTLPQFKAHEVAKPMNDTDSPYDNIDAYSVDLYESTSNWQSLLLGEYIAKGDRFEFVPGKLIQAFNDKKPGIVISHPPDNIQFQYFLDQIRHARYFVFNGVHYDIPSSFVITTQDKPCQFTHPYSVTQLRSEVTTGYAYHYELNLTTYPQFINTYRCDGEKLYTQPGWLQESPEQDVTILVTETVPVAVFAHLLNKSKNKQRIHFVFAADISAPQELLKAAAVPQEPHRNPAASTNLSTHLACIHTNDHDFSAARLKNQYPNADLYYINKESYGGLIAPFYVTPQSATSGYIFSIIPTEIANALTDPNKQNTIIMHGEFSDDFIQQINTLSFVPPYLWINGKKEPVTGKLILVAEKNPGLNPSITTQERFTLDDFLNSLKTGYPRVPLALFEKFSKTVKKLRHRNINFAYVQLKSMFEQLSHVPHKNPFKSFLRTQRNYAELLALTREEFPKRRKALYTDVIKHRLDKIDLTLTYSRYAFSFGDTGTGKSGIIPDLKKRHTVFVGEEAILKWLNTQEKDSPKGDIILAIDEATISNPNTWSIFENLYQKNGFVWYKNRKYPVSPKHKLLFFGNLTSYQGARQEQQLLKRHGAWIEFKPFPESFLRRNVLERLWPALGVTTTPAQRQSVITILTKMYQNINGELKKQEAYLMCSPRNIEMMAWRWAWLCKEFPNEDKLVLAKFAAYREAKTLLKKSSHKALKKAWFTEEVNASVLDTFFNAVGDAFSSMLSFGSSSRAPDKKLEPNPVTHFFEHWKTFKAKALLPTDISDVTFSSLTRSQQSALYQLHETLAMHQQLLNQPDSATKPRLNGLLFSGKPKSQKSSLMKYYLDTHGIKCEELEPGPNMETQLLELFDSGQNVFIRKLSTIAAPLERLLNQLMMGTHPSGREAKKPGFMVFATQDLVAGAPSLALLNRFTKVEVKAGSPLAASGRDAPK